MFVAAAHRPDERASKADLNGDTGKLKADDSMDMKLISTAASIHTDDATMMGAFPVLKWGFEMRKRMPRRDGGADGV